MDLDTAIGQALERPAAYVVASADYTYYYKGSSRNLKERLKDHRAGRESRTKNRRPLRLVYLEYFTSFAEAQQKEQFLKSGAGRMWLKQHLEKQPGQTVLP